MFADLLQDVRLARAQLRQRPMFVIGATLSLAIGMSLATALFTVVDTFLTHPLALPNPDRLIALSEVADDRDMGRIPARLLLGLRDGSSSIEAIAAANRWSHLVGPNGEARRIPSAFVSTNYFDVLGVRPMRGHAFEASNGLPGDRSVVISYRLWQSDFASDPAIIGRELRVEGRGRVIIAVMSPAADFDGARIWLPISAAELNAAAAADEKSAPLYTAVARLRPGASAAEATAEARVVEQRVYGVSKVPRVFSPKARGLADYIIAPMRNALQIWAAAAVIILMLCAVNFATMSLARGMRRRDEIAVRAAVGASRFRLARMLVVEAVCFALLAGALAILFAWWLLGFVRGEIEMGTIPIVPVMSWTTIAFAVLGTAAVGFVFAMAPALELAKVDLRAVMQGGAAAATTRRGELRGRRALVTLQLGLALAAVAVVVALIQADRRFQVANVGFDYERLLMAQVMPRDSTTRRVTLAPLLDELARTPGVEAVAATGSRDAGALWTDNGGDAIRADLSRVSPAFFTTLRVAPIAGRLPSDDEVRSDANVVVAQRGVAVALFGSESAAIGQRVRMKLPRRAAESFTIVAVIPSLGGNGIYDFSASLLSVRRLESERAGTLAVRTSGDPQFRVRDIRRTLAQFDQSLSASDLRTARSTVDATLNATRGRTIFLSAVGALAFLLAIVGVYGLTAYTTELRSRELGIRIAMGAGRRNIAVVALEDVWWMAALGTFGGMAVAARAVAVLDNAYRNPMMPVPLVRMPVGAATASAATLIVIMAIATALPLRRVFRIDVMRVVQGR